MQHYVVTLIFTFGLAVMTLTFKILSGLYYGNCKVQVSDLVGTSVWGVQHHVILFALKVSRSLYCVTSSISHGVINYFPGLWGTGITDAIFRLLINAVIFLLNCHVLILYINCHSLKLYFLYLDIIWTFI